KCARLTSNKHQRAKVNVDTSPLKDKPVSSPTESGERRIRRKTSRRSTSAKHRALISRLSEVLLDSASLDKTLQTLAREPVGALSLSRCRFVSNSHLSGVPPQSQSDSTA